MKAIILLVVLLCGGCAWYQDRMDSANDCLNDPECLSQVENQANFWKATAAASGLPFAGAAAGTLVTGLALFFARKKEK